MSDCTEIRIGINLGGICIRKHLFYNRIDLSVQYLMHSGSLQKTLML